MMQWVSITEAAELLTAAGDRIDRSTLSRYLKQHSEALPQRRDGKANLVDFEALAAHRAENVRLRPVPSPAATSHRGVSPRFAGSQADGAARKIVAEADLRELDLAQRRAELTAVAEVDRAGREAVMLMRAAFDRAVETEALALSIKYGWDERTARTALKGYARSGLEMFHREMLSRIEAMRRAQEGDGDIAAAAFAEASAALQ